MLKFCEEPFELIEGSGASVGSGAKPEVPPDWTDEALELEALSLKAAITPVGTGLPECPSKIQLPANAVADPRPMMMCRKVFMFFILIIPPAKQAAAVVTAVIAAKEAAVIAAAVAEAPDGH